MAFYTVGNFAVNVQGTEYFSVNFASPVLYVVVLLQPLHRGSKCMDFNQSSKVSPSDLPINSGVSNSKPVF